MARVHYILLLIFVGNTIAVSAQQQVSFDLDLSEGDQAVTELTEPAGSGDFLEIELRATVIDTVREFAVHVTFDSRFFEFEDYVFENLDSGEGNVFSRLGGRFLPGSPFVVWIADEDDPNNRTYIIEASLNSDDDAIFGTGLLGVLRLRKTPSLASGITTYISLDAADFVKPDLSTVTALLGGPVTYAVLNGPPQPSTTLLPASGEIISLSGLPEETVSFDWTASTDPEEDPITYSWELYLNDKTTRIYASVPADATDLLITKETLRSVLVTNGFQLGSTVQVFQRVVVSDGDNNVPGPFSELYLAFVNGPPTAPSIIQPTAGSTVTIEGILTGQIPVSWTESTDPEADPISYSWQVLASDQVTVLGEGSTGSATSTTFTTGQIKDILDGAGINPGSSNSLYIRAVANDGFTAVAGNLSLVTVVYGEVNLPPTPVPRITQPLLALNVSGLIEQSVPFSWTASSDPNGGNVSYRWQLYRQDQSTLIQERIIGAATEFSVTLGELEALLETAGVPAGGSITTYQRAIATDDAYTVVGPFSSLIITRGSVNRPPSAVSGLVPSGGTNVLVSGDPDAIGFTANWDAVVDPDGDPVTYRWELSSKMDFSQLIQIRTGLTVPTFSLTTRQLNDMLRDGLNVDGGASITLYHRVIVSDAVHPEVVGEAAEVGFTRGAVTSSESENLPDEFVLRGNYPNPFNPTTTIVFDLPTPATVDLSVFDASGRRIYSVSGREMSAGRSRKLLIHAGSWGSGLYMYRLTAVFDNEQISHSGTLVLAK